MNKQDFADERKKSGRILIVFDSFLCFFKAHISEHPNQQPSHKIQITMGSTEARVDYMGSSILMGVFSNADLQLQDEWKVNLNTVDTSLSEKRYSVAPCSGGTGVFQRKLYLLLF